MWAIIGGSGFESFDGIEEIEELDRKTPFGMTSSGLRRIRVGQGSLKTECLFLSRHGRHHELLPTEVNYRANIFALKRAGVTRVLSVSAVGSLQKELAPGDLVVPSQYIDRTKGVRAATFLGQGLVGHVSLAQPTWSAGASALREIAPRFGFNVHFDKTYICIEGPYFSTQAESKSYREMGADIIGMTNFPEYALAREAGLCYLPLSFVTDYDCWDSSIEHVTLQVVLDTMKKNNQKAVEAIRAIFQLNPSPDKSLQSAGLKSSLMTPLANLPIETKSWLDVVMS